MKKDKNGERDCCKEVTAKKNRKRTDVKRQLKMSQQMWRRKRRRSQWKRWCCKRSFGQGWVHTRQPKCALFSPHFPSKSSSSSFVMLINRRWSLGGGGGGRWTPEFINCSFFQMTQKMKDIKNFLVTVEDEKEKKKRCALRSALQKQKAKRSWGKAVHRPPAEKKIPT